MNENQQSITEWQRITFGETTVGAAWARCWAEILELDYAHYDVGDEERRWRLMAAELPDVMITLYRVAQCLGVDLQAAVNAKMVVNRAREWIVDSAGNGQHKT